jgi:hypothetical protein
MNCARSIRLPARILKSAQISNAAYDGKKPEFGNPAVGMFLDKFGQLLVEENSQI